MPGRPSKLDEVTRRRLIAGVERGLTLTLACQAVGCSTDTMERARNRDAGFAAALREAQGRRADRWLQLVEAGAPKNWLAAAWLLERCHPHEFGRHLVQDRPAAAYDEDTLRALAAERGLDPDEFVAAVARVQHAQAAKDAGADKRAGAPRPIARVV